MLILEHFRTLTADRPGGGEGGGLGDESLGAAAEGAAAGDGALGDGLLGGRGDQHAVVPGNDSRTEFLAGTRRSNSDRYFAGRKAVRRTPVGPGAVGPVAAAGGADPARGRVAVAGEHHVDGVGGRPADAAGPPLAPEEEPVRCAMLDPALDLSYLTQMFWSWLARWYPFPAL